MPSPSHRQLSTTTTDEPQKLAYCIDEAVKVSGLGRSFLYERIGDGTLKSVKIGSRRLILREDLSAFLRSEPQINSELLEVKKPVLADTSIANQTSIGPMTQMELPWQ